jgi:hypothetical protein
MKIRIADRHTLYENPLPQLVSRHSYFPFVQQLRDGSLLASHVLGEAFESVNQVTRLSRSTDMGKTWELLPPVYDKSGKKVPTSDYLKITALPDGRLILFGYEYFREDPELPIGNPKTGGLLPDRIILLRSGDGGKSWSEPEAVPCTWSTQVEASAPIVVLKTGTGSRLSQAFPPGMGRPRQETAGGCSDPPTREKPGKTIPSSWSFPAARSRPMSKGYASSRAAAPWLGLPGMKIF